MPTPFSPGSDGRVAWNRGTPVAMPEAPERLLGVSDLRSGDRSPIRGVVRYGRRYPPLGSWARWYGGGCGGRRQRQPRDGLFAARVRSCACSARSRSTRGARRPWTPWRSRGEERQQQRRSPNGMPAAANSMRTCWRSSAPFEAKPASPCSPTPTTAYGETYTSLASRTNSTRSSAPPKSTSRNPIRAIYKYAAEPLRSNRQRASSSTTCPTTSTQPRTLDLTPCSSGTLTSSLRP